MQSQATLSLRGAEAPKQSARVPFAFHLFLLSGDMVSGPSLWIIFLALKRDLKLAEKEGSAS